MQKNSSRVIAAEGGADYERWHVPEVGDSGAGSQGGAGPAMLTARQLERLQQQAYEEGLALGKREGMEQGRALVQEQARRLAALCQALAEPLRELDETVVDELTQLAIAVARQLVRRELKTDPGQVVAAVQGALAALPVASRELRIHLHPEDAALVREAMTLAPGWQLVEDGAITRGGCRVESDVSRVDATVEQRLAAIAAELLGGERREDRRQPEPTAGAASAGVGDVAGSGAADVPEARDEGDHE